MSINQQQNGILQQIGGYYIPPDEKLSLKSTNAPQNKVVAKALQKIDEAIEEIRELRGDLTKAGFVQPTNATDVTDTTGKALAATENNPSIDDTLANKILKIKEEADSKLNIFAKTKRAYGKTVTIPLDSTGENCAYLVAARSHVTLGNNAMYMISFTTGTYVLVSQIVKADNSAPSISVSGKDLTITFYDTNGGGYSVIQLF